MLAKRKVQPAPDLGGEILRLRGEIESFLDAKVAELMASWEQIETELAALAEEPA